MTPVEPDEPDSLVPDVAGYIEGWRWFLVEGDELQSQNAGGGRALGFRGNYVWTPGPNQAVCFSDPASWRVTVLVNGPDGGVVEEVRFQHGLIPEPSCGCGFWFYKDFDSADMKWSGVLGKIRAWGRVIEGTRGWRSEYAELVAVVAKNDVEAKKIEPIVQKYGVELIRPAEKRYVGVLDNVSNPERAMSGRWRPLIVNVGGKVFKVWPNAKIQAALLRWKGKRVAVRYRIEEDMGYGPSVFIEEFMESHTKVLNGICWECDKPTTPITGNKHFWYACDECGRAFREIDENGRVCEMIPLQPTEVACVWSGTAPTRVGRADGTVVAPEVDATGWIQHPGDIWIEVEYG